jgi:Fe-S-cluster containining protein
MRLAIIESCDGCGACCMVIGAPPFLDEIDLIPKDLQVLARAQKEAWVAAGEPEVPCPWLDLATRRCIHYEDRPNVCREYERGQEECLLARQARGIT